MVAGRVILNSRAWVCNLWCAERIANVILKNLCLPKVVEKIILLEINAFRAIFLPIFSNFCVKTNFAIEVGLKVLLCRFERMDLQNERKQKVFTTTLDEDKF